MISILFFSLVLPTASFASNAKQIQNINQDMFNLYQSGNKQKAFNIYKKTLQKQAEISTGYNVNLFPSTEKEYKAYQDDLMKHGLVKSIGEIKEYTNKSENIHRDIFEAMMTQNPDKMGNASKKLEKLTQNFFSKSSSVQENKNNSENKGEIYDGSFGAEANRLIDTVNTFFNSWSDYISKRDDKGNLKAFSDIHTNTPNSLIITKDDGVVMSTFKVLGKGGYYLFLKARLWIVEGYGEIGDLLGGATSKVFDQ
jgi:hypothetical protein